MWIDCEYDTAVGTIGFRVERVNHNRGGASRWGIQGSPAFTNGSHEPKLQGWCGETNNVSVFARGVVRVVRKNTVGNRAKVEPLSGAALAEALEELGYPELAPAVAGE